MFTLICKALLLPPGINLLLGIVGAIIYFWRKHWGLLIVLISMLSLYLVSTPFIANVLLNHLESQPTISDKRIAQNSANASAIVILTAGNSYAPEYGGSTSSSTSILRAIYGAKLYGLTKLPIIISGGEVKGETAPESTRLKRFLEQSLHVPVWKIEARSYNTYQNALYSKKILKDAHIHRFYLVTSAWHMPRALWAFHQKGLDPIPAPTDYATSKPANWVLAWLPSSSALTGSRLALYEILGTLWYHFEYA